MALPRVGASSWNPEGLKPIFLQGSGNSAPDRSGCSAGCQCSSISMVVWSCPLWKKRLLSVRDICSILPAPTPWHGGLFMQNCPQLPRDLCPGEDSAKQTHYIKSYPLSALNNHLTNEVLPLLWIAEGICLQCGWGYFWVPLCAILLSQMPYKAQKNCPFCWWHRHLTTVLAHSWATKMSEMEFTLTKLCTKFSPSSNSPSLIPSSVSSHLFIVFQILKCII